MPKITEFHKPPDLAAALALLGRSEPATRPLGGGTHFRRGGAWPDAVVDLAALGLSGVTRGQNAWVIGATTTLEQFSAAEDLPDALRRAALRQAPRNIRQRATVGGTLASGDSGTLLVCLLALDARLTIEPGGRLVSLESYLADHREPGHLITACQVPAGRTCAFAEISRTPSDLPILAVAVGSGIAEGRMTGAIVAAGGADQPILVMPEVASLVAGGPDLDATAVASVASRAPWLDDARGSADYRRAMTPVLVKRAAAELLAAAEVHHAG